MHNFLQIHLQIAQDRGHVCYTRPILSRVPDTSQRNPTQPNKRFNVRRNRKPRVQQLTKPHLLNQRQRPFHNRPFLTPPPTQQLQQNHPQSEHITLLRRPPLLHPILFVHVSLQPLLLIRRQEM